MSGSKKAAYEAAGFIAPTITFYDIETSNLAADMGWIQTFSWMNEGDDKPETISIHETKPFAKCKRNDKEIVKKIISVFKDADYLVAHYGNKFDWKFIKARAAVHGLYLPEKLMVDTCLMSRKHFRLQSNRLDNLADFFGLTPKIKVPKSVWMDAGMGCVSALKELKTRCAGDVITLKEIFDNHLKPYCMTIDYNKFYSEFGCRHCGSKRLRKNGLKIQSTVQTWKMEYECQECGGCTYSKPQSLSLLRAA